MSAVPALKVALREIASALWPEAQTYRAVPQVDRPRDLAVIGDAKTTITRPTSGGALRSREETAEIEIIVSSYRPGDHDAAQREASEAAWAMCDLLHDYLRVRGHETLGGICRDAWISSADDSDYPLSDSDGLVVGRCCDITITVTASTRI